MTPLTWRRGRIAATALNTLMVFVNTGRYSPPPRVKASHKPTKTPLLGGEYALESGSARSRDRR